MKISTFDLNLFVVLNAIYTEGSLTKAAAFVRLPSVYIALRTTKRFKSKVLIFIFCETCIDLLST